MARSVVLLGGFDRFDAVQLGWECNLEAREQVGHGRSDLGGLPNPGVAALVFDDFDRVELRQDVAPRVADSDR